jgi:hypothetical protein
MAPAELRREHTSLVRRREPGLWGLRTHPQLAIGHEAHLVETAFGNVLWDCLSVPNDAAIDLIAGRGGVAAIAISHPHFHGAMVDWSRALGDVPIYLHAADRDWVMRPDPAIVYWNAQSVELVPGARIVRCGGHFPGASVLHWRAGADGRGVLLTSDTVQLVADPDRVSFMLSYPNLIPLGAAAVEGIWRAIEPLAFDRVYGSFQGSILQGAKTVIERSVERYIAAVRL